MPPRSRTLTIADDVAKNYPDIQRHVITDIVMSVLDHPENLSPDASRVVRATELGWAALDCLNNVDVSGAKNVLTAQLTVLEEVG